MKFTLRRLALIVTCLCVAGGLLGYTARFDSSEELTDKELRQQYLSTFGIVYFSLVILVTALLVSWKIDAGLAVGCAVVLSFLLTLAMAAIFALMNS